MSQTNLMKLIGLFALISLSLFACSEDKLGTCQKRLDDSNFLSVAKDTSCDNYERASAYLGLAGFGFAVFLNDLSGSDEKATDSTTSEDSSSTTTTSATTDASKEEDTGTKISETLGLDVYTIEKNNVDGWKDPNKGLLRFYESALCLVGPDSLVETLIANEQCSKSGYRNIQAERPRRDLEISLFALIGEILIRTFGELDTDRDGEVSQEEQDGFAGVELNLENESATKLTPDAKTFQMVSGGINYLVRQGTYEIKDFSVISDALLKENVTVTAAYVTASATASEKTSCSTSTARQSASDLSSAVSASGASQTVSLPKVTLGRPEYDPATGIKPLLDENGDIVYMGKTQFEKLAGCEAAEAIFDKILDPFDTTKALISEIPQPDLDTLPSKKDSDGSLLTATGIKCSNKGSTNFTGITGSDFNTKASFNCPVENIDIIPIINIDAITTVFKEDTDLQTPLEFITIYAQRALALVEEIEELGLDTGEVRDSVDSILDKMDNGGGCEGDGAALLFKVISNIAINAATDADVFAKNLKTKNLLKLSVASKLNPELSADDLAACPDGVPECPEVTEARLVYKTSSGGYTDAFDLAIEDSIVIPLEKIAELAQTPSVAGDRVITFQELLCNAQTESSTKSSDTKKRSFQNASK